MTKTKTLLKILLLPAVLAAASCAPVDIPPPAVTPQAADAFFIDPRTGYDAPIPAAIAPKFDTAWRWAVAGNDAEAQKRLAEILARQPGFLPATLALAAIDIRAGRYDQARTPVAEALERVPGYLAARVYEAEIAWREQKTRAALDLYRALAATPGAPAFAAERAAELQQAIFNELYAAAQAAPAAEAARLLREALALNAGAIDARILLAQKLVAQKQYEEARRELDPLLDTAADRAEVQEMLGEIEVGRGKYEEAIVRYDRLARRTKEPRYQRRLDEIKLEWNAANMPSHYRAALDSPSLTRADLATLLYWTVPAVRFAQNLPSPPIAVDIENVPGREEMIRAIAIGLYDVDQVTRRVSPYRAVTAGRLSAHLGRLLTLRGASCARGTSGDRALAACNIPDPMTGRASEDPITGREAAALLTQVAKVF